METPEESRTTSVIRVIAFVASAADAALVLRFAWEKPLVALGMLIGLFGIATLRWLARRRARRTLLSGNVDAVLREWSSSISRAPEARTMAPLMTATAFAANGWVEQVREVLAAAHRGPAWDAALEHRLFIDTLLLTFEGDREEAMRQSERLVRLPLPQVEPAMRDRIAALRGGVAALARAFAHKCEAGDREALEQAARISPLVHWAMRYASAVVAIDEGDTAKARGYLEGAPDWPSESAFRMFHDEIASHSK